MVKNVFPPCPFHALTGFYCPGCGSQRAFSALVHGELISALHYNLLMVACLPLLFYSAFIFVLNSLRRKELVQKIFYSVSFVRWLFVVVVLFWIARNIPVQPFALLAPHA